MSRILTAALAGALVLVPLTAQEQGAEATPKKAPPAADKAAAAKEPEALQLGAVVDAAIALPDLDGRTYSTKDFAGRITVVNFWSTTCPIMRGWEGTLKKIVGDYADKGVTFLMINSNEGNGEIADRKAEKDKQPYQKIRDYLAKNELPYTVLVDHDSIVAGRFDAKTTPHVFVFDKEAKLVYRGLIDDDARGDEGEEATHHLRDTLDTLLLGRLVKPTETRPHGCSIKKPAGARGRGNRADR
jgi:thiol-disulfide isomerase/thioredoxin